jgi:hypothetical protein
MAEDLFEDAPAAPVQKYPTVKQIGNGDVAVSVVYAKGADNEVTKSTSGRLCIFRPASGVETVPDRNNPGKMQKRIQVDVILLTGPPITETLDKDDEVTGKLDPPLVPGDVIASMYMSQTLLVGQLDQLLTNGKATGRMTVGRLMLLPAGGSRSKPWAIGTAVDPKQKAADIKLATQWVKDHPAPDLFATA